MFYKCKDKESISKTIPKIYAEDQCIIYAIHAS